MSKPWHIALTLTLLILMLGGTLSRAQQDDRSYLGTRTSINNGKTVIVEVVPGSPAAAAGLQPNDVILAVGSDLITAERPLETLLANYRPDDGVQLSISRGGQPLTIGVILGKRPAVATSAGTNSATNSVTAAPPSAVPTLSGSNQITVTPNLSAGFLGAKLTNGSDGVHIVGVVSGSPAELAGLKAGDLFAAIDDQGIGTAQQVQAILNSRKPGDSIKIRVTRNGQLFETTAHLTGRSGDTSATMQVIPAATTSTSELTQFGAGFAALGFNTSIQVEGLRVTQVASGSTAEKSGLQVDDILIRVGDQKFESGDVLPMLIRLFSPGTQRINLIRGGQSVFIEWTTPNDMSDAINAQPARLGVSYDIVTPQNAAELKLSVEYGALVKAVSAGSPADVAGIKVGDVIIAVEEDKVDAKRTLAIRMIPYVTGDTLMLSVVRGSETLKIRVTLVNRGNALIPGEKILL